MATIPQKKSGKTDAGRTGNGEKGGKVEIIHPPNLLKMKVGSGGVDPDRIAKAEAAVAELAESYIDWALKDLAELQARFAAIRAETADPRQRVLDLFQTAHDMKGQGATFGYPLVTQVAKHLCHYVEGQLERDQLPDLTIDTFDVKDFFCNVPRRPFLRDLRHTVQEIQTRNPTWTHF